MRKTSSTAFGSKRCVVSFASNGRESYCNAQQRLLNSLDKVGWTEPILFRSLQKQHDERIMSGQYPNTSVYGFSPTHQECPYAFKTFLIQEAYEMGFTKIVWVDSTIVVKRHPEEFFELLEVYHVLACNNDGYMLSDWVADCVVNELEIDPTNMRQIMGCTIGFDLESSIGLECFNKWFEMARDGRSFSDKEISTRENFIHTRHDQSCLSAIMNKMNIPIQDYGIVSYYGIQDTDDSIFINTGTQY